MGYPEGPGERSAVERDAPLPGTPCAQACAGLEAGLPPALLPPWVTGPLLSEGGPCPGAGSAPRVVAQLRLAMSADGLLRFRAPRRPTPQACGSTLHSRPTNRAPPIRPPTLHRGARLERSHPACSLPLARPFAPVATALEAQTMTDANPA